MSKLEAWEPSICWMCDVKLEHRQHLQNHAEKVSTARSHGAVLDISTTYHTGWLYSFDMAL